MAANTVKEGEPPSYEEVMRGSAPPMQGKVRISKQMIKVHYLKLTQQMTDT